MHDPKKPYPHCAPTGDPARDERRLRDARHAMRCHRNLAIAHAEILRAHIAEKMKGHS